jgi:hypothetical protein
MTHCERKVGEKACGARTVVFAMGQSLCAVHEPKGDPHCSHSLGPAGRCAFCGAKTS